MFGKFQDLIKGCMLKFNNNNNNITTNKSSNLKHVSTKEFHNARVEQLNLIENEFKDKSDRIKVNKFCVFLELLKKQINFFIFIFFNLFCLIFLLNS